MTKHQHLAEETIQGVIAYGEVLRRIHNRLISEDYVIKCGHITPPEPKETDNIGG